MIGLAPVGGSSLTTIGSLSRSTVCLFHFFRCSLMKDVRPDVCAEFCATRCPCSTVRVMAWTYCSCSGGLVTGEEQKVRSGRKAVGGGL